MGTKILFHKRDSNNCCERGRTARDSDSTSARVRSPAEAFKEYKNTAYKSICNRSDPDPMINLVFESSMTGCCVVRNEDMDTGPARRLRAVRTCVRTLQNCACHHNSTLKFYYTRSSNSPWTSESPHPHHYHHHHHRGAREWSLLREHALTF